MRAILISFCSESFLVKEKQMSVRVKTLRLFIPLVFERKLNLTPLHITDSQKIFFSSINYRVHQVPFSKRVFVDWIYVTLLKKLRLSLDADKQAI